MERVPRASVQFLVLGVDSNHVAEFVAAQNGGRFNQGEVLTLPSTRRCGSHRGSGAVRSPPARLVQKMHCSYRLLNTRAPGMRSRGSPAALAAFRGSRSIFMPRAWHISCHSTLRSA